MPDTDSANTNPNFSKRREIEWIGRREIEWIGHK